MRLIRLLFARMLYCNCGKNYGIKNLHQIDNTKIVGRCLNCNKRVYGKIFFVSSGDQE